MQTVLSVGKIYFVFNSNACPNLESHHTDTGSCPVQTSRSVIFLLYDIILPLSECAIDLSLTCVWAFALYFFYFVFFVFHPFAFLSFLHLSVFAFVSHFLSLGLLGPHGLLFPPPSVSPYNILISLLPFLSPKPSYLIGFVFLLACLPFSVWLLLRLPASLSLSLSHLLCKSETSLFNHVTNVHVHMLARELHRNKPPVSLITDWAASLKH